MLEINLDPKENIESIKQFKPYSDYQVDSRGRPVSAPHLVEDQTLIAGFDQYIRIRHFVCDGVEDMQSLYDAYASGSAKSVGWFGVMGLEYIITINNIKS